MSYHQKNQKTAFILQLPPMGLGGGGYFYLGDTTRGGIQVALTGLIPVITLNVYFLAHLKPGADRKPITGLAFGLTLLASTTYMIAGLFDIGLGNAKDGNHQPMKSW